jgi:hypothetical protein
MPTVTGSADLKQTVARADDLARDDIPPAVLVCRMGRYYALAKQQYAPRSLALSLWSDSTESLIANNATVSCRQKKRKVPTALLSKNLTASIISRISIKI